MTVRKFLRVAALVLAGLASGEVRADIVQVFSRAELSGNDLLDWGTKGSNGDYLSNPFVATSNGGLGTGVSKDSTEDFQLLVQSAPGGWSGNFSPGDTVLWTNSYPSTALNGIILVFDTPVRGAGANMQQVNALASFKGVLDAYDAANTLLATVSAIGISNANADGSAVFLGMKSTEANIKTIRFRLDAAPFNYIGSYGINQVGLLTAARAVPEPGSLALLGLGSLALLGYAGRRHLAKKFA